MPYSRSTYCVGVRFSCPPSLSLFLSLSCYAVLIDEGPLRLLSAQACSLERALGFCPPFCHMIIGQKPATFYDHLNASTSSRTILHTTVCHSVSNLLEFGLLCLVSNYTPCAVGMRNEPGWFGNKGFFGFSLSLSLSRLAHCILCGCKARERN